MIKKCRGGAADQAAGGRSRSRNRSRGNSRRRSNSSSSTSTSSKGSSVGTANSMTIAVETVATAATTTTIQKPSQLQKQQEELLKVLSSQLTDDQNATLKEILLLQQASYYYELSAAVMENKDKTAQNSENEENKTAKAKHEDLLGAGSAMNSWKKKIETKFDTIQKDITKIKQDMSSSNIKPLPPLPSGNEGIVQVLSLNNDELVIHEPPLLFSNTDSSKGKLFVASAWPPMKDGKHRWTVKCLQPSTSTSTTPTTTATTTANISTDETSTTEERADYGCSLGVTTVFDSKNNKKHQQEEQNEDIILGKNFPGWAYQNCGIFSSKVSFRWFYWFVSLFYFDPPSTEGFPCINPGDTVTFVLDFTYVEKKNTKYFGERNSCIISDVSDKSFQNRGNLFASVNGGALFQLASQMVLDSESKGGYLPAATIRGLEVEFCDYHKYSQSDKKIEHPSLLDIIVCGYTGLVAILLLYALVFIPNSHPVCWDIPKSSDFKPTRRQRKLCKIDLKK